MGTRNLTMVILDRKPVIAQYGQYDGYPDGQGLTALKFVRLLRSEPYRDAFIEKLAYVRFGTKEELEGLNVEKYPPIHRDIAAGILDYVRTHASSSNPLLLHDSSDFAADSLFCEWAYVIDLDNNTFEVYKGFNKHPLEEKDRFFYLCVPDRAATGTSGYYPIRLAKSWPLKKHPTKKEFLDAFDT